MRYAAAMRVMVAVAAGVVLAQPRPSLAQDLALPQAAPVPLPLPPDLAVASGGSAVTLGALCREGAAAPVLPGTLALSQMAQLWARNAVQRAKVAGEAESAYDGALDLPWAEILAEASAELPPRLADLPLLTTLAEAEEELQADVEALSRSSLIAVAAELEAALLRADLPDRAALFAAVQANASILTAQPSPPDPALAEEQAAAERQLLDAMYDYPEDAALRRVVGVMAFGDPALRETFRARLPSLSDERRLAWLVGRLSEACHWNDWLEPEEAPVILSRTAAAPRAILLLAEAVQRVRAGGIAGYIASYDARMAPELLALFRARGLEAEAELLAAAMELFPTPWPRDDLVRLELIEADAALWRALGDLALPEGSLTRLRVEMLQIAREAGLTPRI